MLIGKPLARAVFFCHVSAAMNTKTFFLSVAAGLATLMLWDAIKPKSPTNNPTPDNGGDWSSWWPF